MTSADSAVEIGSSALPHLAATPATGLIAAAAAHPVTGLADAAEALVPGWTALAGDAHHANPFLRPEMLLPALRRLPGGREVELLTVRLQGRLVLLLPVRREARTRHLPVPALVSWRHTHHFLGTPLVAAGLTETESQAVWVSLLRGLQGAHGRSDGRWLVLGDLDVDVAARVERAAASLGRPTCRVDSYARAQTLRSSESHPDPLLTPLSGRHRKDLRRARRRLSESLGGLDVVDRSAPDRVDEGLRRFVALESAGWKGADGGAIACHEDERAWLHEAGAALAATGRLDLLLLEGPDAAVAAGIALRDGDTAYTFKTAFDEGHRESSPGMQLSLDQFARFAEADVRRVDSCAVAGHPMADRLHPDRRSLTTLAVGLSATGALAVRGLPLAIRLAERHHERRRHRTHA